MLRECRRVLEPAGRLAVVVVEPASGLDRAALAEAVRLGPSRITTSAPIRDHVEAAGLRVERLEDWTAELRELLLHTLESMRRLERDLRAEEGNDGWDAELSRKERLLEGVEAGVLRRTFLLARHGASSTRA